MNSSWLAEKGLQFTKKLYFCAANGELPEWSIGADSKSVEPYGVPGVRIPHSPPWKRLFRKPWFQKWPFLFLNDLKAI